MLKDSEGHFAELSDADRHLASQDAQRFEPRKNMGAMECDTGVSSNRTSSSSWMLGLFTYCTDLGAQVKKIMKIMKHQLKGSQAAASLKSFL